MQHIWNLSVCLVTHSKNTEFLSVKLVFDMEFQGAVRVVKKASRQPDESVKW